MSNVSYFEFNNSIYNISRIHKARLTATDSQGNTATKDINITVFVNEEEARNLSIPVYDLFLYFSDGWLLFNVYKENLNVGAPYLPFITSEFDRLDLSNLYGDEYSTKWDGLTAEESESVNKKVELCGGEPYMKSIPPSTAADFEQELYEYLMHLQCNCNQWLYGPSCE